MTGGKPLRISHVVLIPLCFVLSIGCGGGAKSPPVSGGAGPDRTISPPGEDAVSRELGDREPESGLPIWIELVSPAMGRAFERDFGKPNMTYLSPTQKFEAVIHCDVGKVTADEVRMRLNYKPVDFKYDSASGGLFWAPADPLPEGEYLLDISVNDDSRFSDWDSWKFKVRYSPPTIEALFRGDKDNEIILCLSDSESLKTLTDTARWSVSKIVEEKSEKNSVMLVEPLGWTQQTVRVTLASKFERSESAAHEIAFNGSRGETKRYFPSDEERRRGISDYDDDMGWLLTHCADEEERDAQYNICCDTQPSECIFQTRVGDCWEIIEAGDFVNHTHQAEEGEVHCAGIQTLGNAQTGSTPCFEYYCWQQYEEAKINLDSPNWTDASLMEDNEDAVMRLFFRNEYREGFDSPEFNISEIGNNVHSISRFFSTTYDDWVKVNITGSGEEECGTEFWQQLKWRFGGDHYNPIFLDESGQQAPLGEGIHLGSGEDAYNACLAAGYSQDVADRIDRSDCYTLWFDVRDVYRFPVEEYPGERETNGRMDGEVAIGAILGQTFHYFTTGQAVGYIDEQPLADPFYGDDPDEWPGERYFFALDLWAVLDNAMDAGLYLPFSELPQYGEDITLQFLLMDDVGNWRKEQVDLFQTISISDPLFVDYDNTSGLFDVHIFDQPILPNPTINDQQCLAAVWSDLEAGDNFFYPPHCYRFIFENQMDKVWTAGGKARGNYGFNHFIHTVDATASAYPGLGSMTAELQLALPIPNQDVCEYAVYLGGIAISPDPLNSNALFVSNFDENGIQPEDRYRWTGFAGGDNELCTIDYAKYLKRFAFIILDIGEDSPLLRKGSGIVPHYREANPYRYHRNHQEWFEDIVPDSDGDSVHPSYTCSQEAFKSGGFERVCVYRDGTSPNEHQTSNLAVHSMSDLIVFFGHAGGGSNPVLGRFTTEYYPGEQVQGDHLFYSTELGTSWLTPTNKVKWCVLAGCNTMDAGTGGAAAAWKGVMINANGLESIMGWQGENEHEFDEIKYMHPDDIYSMRTTWPWGDRVLLRFLNEFDPYTVRQPALSKYENQQVLPSDPAVIAFMEAAYDEVTNAINSPDFDKSKQVSAAFRMPVALEGNSRWEIKYKKPYFGKPKHSIVKVY